MLVKPVTLAAAVLAASATRAFLLPPEVTETDIQIADAATVVAPSSAESQLVKLDCPGCPVVIDGPRGTRIIPGKPNHLELTFKVDHQPDGDHLLLNNFELYPNPIPGILTAPQIPDWKPWNRGKDGGGPFGWHHRNKDHDHHGDHHKDHDHHDGEHKHHGPPPFLRVQPAALGFAMQTNPSTARDPDSQLELVTIDFQVVEVANAFVSGISELHIKLIKDASGRLMIGNIEQSAPGYRTGAVEPEKCTTLLCKWLEAIFPKGPVRPCHGPKPAPGPVSAVHHTSVPAGEESRMRHDHSWGQLFKNIASHILLPVLIGIVAGVSVSV